MALLGEEFAQELMETKLEDYTPVPAGEYVLTVSSAEIKDTRSGGKYIKVQFDIVGPSYQGRKLFANINYINSSTRAEQIGRQELRRLQIAAGIPDPLIDTDQLRGATVKASVTIREGENGYGPSNNVKNYKPYDGSMPQAPASTGDAILPPAGGGFSRAFAQPQAANAANIKW